MGLSDKSFKKGLILKDGDSVVDKKARDNTVVFADGQFLRDVFIPYINKANSSSGWNYDIDWLEDVQISKYGVDKHYAWHHDAMCYIEGVGHKNYEGRERKLTALTLLSDDFSGGEFELSHQIIGNNNDIKI